MLEVAGRLADGTATWMTGTKTLADHTVPTINKAAKDAGRPAPRVIAALPFALTHDPAGARDVANKVFAIYGKLPSYRAMLDREGAANPATSASSATRRCCAPASRGCATPASRTSWRACIPRTRTPRRTTAFLKSELLS